MHGRGANRASGWGVGGAQVSRKFVLNGRTLATGALHTLVDAARTCVRESCAALSGRQVSRVRRVLAGTNSKHGLPGLSEGFAAYAAAIEARAATGRATHAQCAEALQGRLAPLEAGRGLEDPSTLLTPVTHGALTYPMPPVLVAAAERTRIGSVAQLLEAG